MYDYVIMYTYSSKRIRREYGFSCRNMPIIHIEKIPILTTNEPMIDCWRHKGNVGNSLKFMATITLKPISRYYEYCTMGQFLQHPLIKFFYLTLGMGELGPVHTLFMIKIIYLLFT